MAAAEHLDMVLDRLRLLYADVPGLEARVGRHLPVLLPLLSQVYGQRADFAAQCAQLAERMAGCLSARPAELRALDTAREANPDWFCDSRMLGYSTYVDRFAGDLPGLIDRVPYLQDLGITYLHLLPFWRVRPGDSDGGFAVSDYGSVDPRLGSIDDLDRLTARLRAAGISLCADLVLNHTADDHPWALAAKSGDPAARDFYHIFADRAEALAYEAHLLQVFPQTAPGNFTHVPEAGGWVWTTFYPFQWDLNYANPAVFVAMAGVMMDLANRGAEVFRLDSAAFLWKRLGTICRSEPETHLILRAYRAIMAIVAPAVLLKSEVIAPVADAARYLGTEAAPECHLAYHAGLMTAGWAALAEQSASLPRAVLAAAPPPPHGACWITYVRCHDDIGWQPLAPQAGADPQPRLKRIADFFSDGRSYARGEAFQAGGGNEAHGLNGTAASLVGLETAVTLDERDAAHARLRLLYGLAFAAGGLPVINMGDEQGLLNDWSYANDPARASEGRWLHRPAFAECPGAGTGLAALATLRQRLPPAAPKTAPALLESGADAVLAFSRGQDSICLFNFSGQAQPVTLPLDGCHDRLSGAAWTGLLPAYGMAWLVKLASPL
jgi:amylosucrase